MAGGGSRRRPALPGNYIACELPGGEPIVVVRGPDHALRGFYNVCRHHAAAVVTESAVRRSSSGVPITDGPTPSTAR